MNNLSVAPPKKLWHFDPTDRVTIKDVDHACIRSDGNGHVMQLVDNTHITQFYSHDEIEDLRAKSLLKVTRYAYLRSTQYRDPSFNELNLVDLSPSERRELFFAVHMCDRTLTLEGEGKASRTDKSLRPLIEQIYAEWLREDLRTQTADARCGARPALQTLIPPSPSTLRRWLRRYEGCEFDVMSLVKLYGKSGNRSARLPTNLQELVDQFARKYISRLRPSKASLYAELVAEIDLRNKADGATVLRAPCKNTFARAISKLDTFEVMAGRYGEKYALRRLAILQNGLQVTRPLERVEMDEWKVPLKLILQNAGVWAKLSEAEKAKIAKISLWVHTVIDCATRIILAARIIRTPSAAAAIETLNMAINDKTAYAAMAGCEKPWDQCGVPALASTDNGAYVHADFRGVLNDLGSEHALMIAGQPGMRGLDERSYRMLHDGLISGLNGRTFQNIVVRGDYQSAAEATLDVEEFGRALIRYIVDVYHLKPHAGLGGMTPLDKWNELRARYMVVPPPHRDINRHIFGVPLIRRIGNRGVRVLGLDYQSEELQRLRYQIGQKSVSVRFDPHNLGSVSVRTKQGWVTVRCLRKGMENVPMVQWLLTVAEQRRHASTLAKAHEPTMLRALRDIQALADAAVARANIAFPILSDADLRKFEKTLFQSFSWADEEDDGDLAASLLADEPDAADGRYDSSVAVADEDAALPTPWFGLED